MSKLCQRAKSPSKGAKRTEQKVQFAPEPQGIQEQRSAGKPPEVPRHTSARAHSCRLHAASSLGNLPSSSSSSTTSRHTHGRGTCSLERPPSRPDSSNRLSPTHRRRPGSFNRHRANNDVLCSHATDLSRSQSLEKRNSLKLPVESDMKQNKKHDHKLKDNFTRDKNGKTYLNDRSPSGERGKLYSKSQINQAILTQNGANRYPCPIGDSSIGNRVHSLSKSLTDCSHKSKRPMSRSPKRFFFDKENDGCDKENEKLANKKRRDLSKMDAQERNRTGHRESDDEKFLFSGKNAKPEHFWKFEKDVMWSYSHNGAKRVGLLLFNCTYLENHLNNSLAEKYEMSFKFSQADSKLIRILMESHGLREVSTASVYFNLYWGNAHFSPNEIRQLQEWQKINHFPRSSELTRKDRLYTNIKRMQRQFGVKLFDFIPASFVLPTEYREFCDTHLRERGTWIVKPVASSQGKGIYLVSQVDQVPPDETALVCRYLDAPLLVDGYKCDLRLYVAVTSLDPMVVYLYEEGLVRLATIKYQHGKNLWNPCIHLTNYSVNKFHSNYIQNEDPEVDDRGNKWSLSAFLRHLKAQGIDTGALMRGIEDVIIKSLLSASYQMNTATNMFVPHPRNCFELYGFDILIDSQLKPWILEVNLSPSLNIDQPLDLKIKSSMLADLFSLVGIPVCNPNTARPTSRHNVYRKLPNLRHSTETYERSQYGSRWGSSANGNIVPTAEEVRIFRQMREEYERKGGWARIYPTPDSWAMYGSLQEYDSPLNFILHSHLYPSASKSNRFFRVTPLKMSSVSSTGLASSLERLSCYERALPKGLSFVKSKLRFNNKQKEKSTKDLEKVKASLVTALENGLTLSKYQARMAFSVYLQHIQRRLMIGCDQEKQTDLVFRFLRSASRTLHLPVNVQPPSKTLPQEARAVVISKQLGDFIQAYTKETHLYLDHNVSASCTSLSSQCPMSTVPTPSEPTQSTPFGCYATGAFSHLDSKEKDVAGVPSGEEIQKSLSRKSDRSFQRSGLQTIAKKFNSLGRVKRPSTCKQATSSSSSLLSFSSMSDCSSSIPPDSSSPSSVTRQHSLASIHSYNASISMCPSFSKPRLASLSASSSSTSSCMSGIHNSSSVSSMPAVDESSKKTVMFFERKLKRIRSDGDSGLCSTDDECGGSNRTDDEDLTDNSQMRDIAGRKLSNSDDGIAMELYRSFISNAGEADLEEVLALQTRMHNSVGVFLDPARKSRSHQSASSSTVTTPSSCPRTPTASPQGSPRRARKSPVHGERAGNQTNWSEPVTNEPHSASKENRKPVSLGCSSGFLPLATSVQSSACCLFGNILKASLKGTKASFNA